MSMFRPQQKQTKKPAQKAPQQGRTFDNPPNFDLHVHAQLASNVVKVVKMDSSKEEKAEAEANLDNVVKGIIWDAVISIKKLPDEKEAKALVDAHRKNLLEGPYSPRHVETITSRMHLALAALRNQQQKMNEAAKEALSERIGEIIWGAVMARKKFPNEQEAAALTEVFLKLGPKEVIQPIVEKCLNRLVELHNDMNNKAAILQSMRSLTASELKDAQEKMGDAMHREWQAGARKDGKKDRFKPCLAPGNKEAGETELKAELKLKAEKAEAKLKEELKKAHPEIKDIDQFYNANKQKDVLEREILKDFNKFYKYVENKEEPHKSGWQEDILNLDYSVLQSKNKTENDTAAGIAVELVNRFLSEERGPQHKVSGDDVTIWLLETAGPETHDKWLLRNKSWATPTQLKPFGELPSAQAILDFQVLTTIELLGENKDLAKQPSKPEQPMKGMRKL